MTKILTIDEKRQIKNHANRNITYLLDRLAVSYTTRGDGLLQALCPCKQHPGDRDNSTAWSWRTDLGKWVCWSHHCEEARGNDIFGLVSSVLETNFGTTLEWILKTLSEKHIDIATAAAEPEFAHRGISLHIHEPLSTDNLKFLQPDPEYLLGRGFDRDVLRSYQVGLWSRPGTFMHDRVVFPVRDHEGHLVGYTGRTIHPEEYFTSKEIKYKKWIHGRHFNRWPTRGEFFTSSILFNLDRAKKLLDRTKSVVLVEGPLDGMRLEEAGVHNWVATLSTNFCAPHRTLLVNYGVTDLYVAYDNDENNAGEKGWERMHRIVGDLFKMHRVSLPLGRDCGDLSVDEVCTLFKDIRC